MEPELIRDAAVTALEDIKARDIEILDVRPLTSLFDWMLIASADSSRQSRALARQVLDKAKEAGVATVRMEGEASGEWILVDLGSVVVHVMQTAAREYYNLSELWGGHGGLPRRNPSVVLPMPMRRSESPCSSASI